MPELIGRTETIDALDNIQKETDVDKVSVTVRNGNWQVIPDTSRMPIKEFLRIIDALGTFFEIIWNGTELHIECYERAPYAV